MNKKELIIAASQCSTNLNKLQLEEALDAFLKVTETELKKGEKIKIVGFGTLETSTRKEREGRNPSTGEKITLPKITSVKFRMGANLSNALNE